MSVFKRMKLSFLHNFEMTKVFAFVGSSGSGKSYNVGDLAKKYDIDLVIDDGLLIKGNKVLGGMSAKQEKNEMMAVKRAIFKDLKHRNEIIRIIDKEHYPRILILGTSVKMISRITGNLCLPSPSKVIRIEDVRSKEDIEYSHRIRNTQGKHIIPLPYVELKRYINRQKDEDVYIDEAFLNQKTMVSPKFSRSAIVYSDEELKVISEGVLREIRDSVRVSGISVKRGRYDTSFEVTVADSLNSSAEIDADAMFRRLSGAISGRFDAITVTAVRCGGRAHAPAGVSEAPANADGG